MERLRSQNQVKTAGSKRKWGAAALTLALAAATTGCSGSSNKQEHTPPPSSIAAPPTGERPVPSGETTAYVCEGIRAQQTGRGMFRVIAKPIISPRGYPMDIETSSKGLDIALPAQVSHEPVRWYNLNGVAMHGEDDLLCPERQVSARQIVQPNGHRTWVASTTQGGPLRHALDIGAVRGAGVVHLDFGELTNQGLGQVLDQATAIARAEP